MRLVAGGGCGWCACMPVPPPPVVAWSRACAYLSAATATLVAAALLCHHCDGFNGDGTGGIPAAAAASVNGRWLLLLQLAMARLPSFRTGAVEGAGARACAALLLPPRLALLLVPLLLLLL